MENKAVSDTGPIIHLSEISLSEILKVFSEVKIPEEVFNELKKNKISPPKFIKIISLSASSKDMTKILVNQQDLGLGEAQAISLVLQEKANYFLTDDLEARAIAKSMNLQTHGSIGIILRAYRNKIIDKKTAIVKTRELQYSSSLFITKDLIDDIIKSIEEFKH